MAKFNQYAPSMDQKTTGLVDKGLSNKLKLIFIQNTSRINFLCNLAALLYRQDPAFVK